jgi:uncharacterized protein (TIGR00269 family)
MLCDVCKLREAEVYQAHSGLKLCRECFIADVTARVEKEARRLGLFNARKILLAVSGGKDSYVLADTLSSVLKGVKLVAYNITEGIAGYNRAEHVRKLRDFLKDRGIELIEGSFKGQVGYTLDEMVAASKAKGLNVSACTFCGGFRRKLINDVAREVKADFVATGHNLDDEVQTYLINFLRGDVSRLVREGEEPVRLSDLFVQRVKPLRRVYEWETAMYAYFRAYEFQEVECPYITQRPTLRAKVRELLYSLESQRPGALLRLLELFDSLASSQRRKLVKSLPSQLPRCKICGEPTSYGREICKNCELLLASGLEPKYAHQNLPIS